MEANKKMTFNQEPIRQQKKQNHTIQYFQEYDNPDILQLTARCSKYKQ